jgi:hypothetical protein
VPASRPSFSPFPFARLRRASRHEAAIESAIARWIAARPLAVGSKRRALAGAAVAIRVVGACAPRHRDPHAVLAEVRVGGLAIPLAAPALAVRGLAQRVLGGPADLAAPRPATTAEEAIWALAIAAAIDDLGIAAEVWPFAEPLPSSAPDDAIGIELAVTLGDSPISVVAACPRAIEVRAAPARPWPAWTFDVPIVVARAAVPVTAIGTLAVGDAITVERVLELVIGPGHVGLRAAPGAVEATAATGYVPAEMALPDEVHLELTVQLGTTRLTVRQLAELAIGSIVPLGRPLAGPFDVRAAGRTIGQGELVDLDGELGVRIVSLAQE